MRDVQDFDSLKIKLASPETIKSWSYGEVKKPETINYRTLRPEKDGLFCERIFGTTKEWECYCGKFKSIRYKGVVCDRCGVEVTHFKVRRERTGHIELAAPVSHIWYYRSVPSRMGLLLDLQVAALRSVLYYEKYIVIDAGDTDLKKGQLLSEEEYQVAQEHYGSTFIADMGAEAVKLLLENLDLDALSYELREKMREKGLKSDKRLLRRIEIVENFRASGNKVSWMILDVIPVIPPELRPMVQLDGGRFATSDLNDLYRRVINRNNRLKRLQQLSAPDIIIRNEKRMLQEAVDALFDNTKRKRAVKGASNRPLKSISDLLKGKQGRFRLNLLGKRVDYSGRSVIVVGPELKMWQCGLPTKMALELFKPFLMKKLVVKEVVGNIKKAKMLVESEAPEVYAILDEVVREHPVMLNRAPTLHRLGIQAYEPVLVEGKAIKLHPLACKAFNADFDGDQMAIHVPLTQAAQMECWTLMLSARNLLDPANGDTIVYPSQDMVLGIYYMTSIKPDGKGTNKRFSSPDEVRLAAESRSIDWQSKIIVPSPKDSFEGGAFSGKQTFKKGDLIETTAGRLAFNEAMLDEIDFVNEQMTDKKLKKMIEFIYHLKGSWITIQMLDAIKAVGYKNATFYGASLSMDDILVPDEKVSIMEKANKDVEKIKEEAKLGVVTQGEIKERIKNVWTTVNTKLTDKLMDNLEKDKGGFNTIYMMATSGARGSKGQISQLGAMRGLMEKPNGDTIELPIKSNLKEGLSVIEYFISSNGARKTLADTALKTANAGYMTRRLVDVAQDVVVNEDDCRTINGIDYAAIKDGDEIKVHLAERIAGHYTIERVVHPITGELLCDVNEYVTDEMASKIEAAGVEKVKLRTVLTCEAKHGICVKCYGKNLARNKIVEIGEAVGIIAAQSIGQPGTQLTLRTFHGGGAANVTTEDNHIVLKYDAFITKITGKTVAKSDGKLLFTRKGIMSVIRVLDQVKFSKGDKVLVEEGKNLMRGTPLVEVGGKSINAAVTGRVHIENDCIYLVSKEQKSTIVNGSTLYVKVGDYIAKDVPIGEFDPYNDPIIAESDGYVHFEDIIPGITLNQRINPSTGVAVKVITDLHLDVKQPRMLITDEAGNERGSYYLPAGTILRVEDKVAIKAGDTLATMAKTAVKASNITSGLPRVSELFDARKPKNPCVLAQITGLVKFKGITKGKRVITIEDEFGQIKEHLVPTTKNMLVRDGDTVEAGEPLCAGAPNPQDILTILGENALHNYLMNEIQDVYRAQGVNINDKHIGVIVHQMLKKVEIVVVGDTKFFFGQQVDKYKFHEENDRIIAEGGLPAIGRPLLQGITKASLSVDSFISAASFQETTKVLTNAAIKGEVDGLHGIKENVAIGHMIPAGTGIKNYKDIKLTDDSDTDLDEQMNEILEKRRQESESESQLEDTSFETEDAD
jgi:DNA-directed RNA polymerase subunit beta'